MLIGIFNGLIFFPVLLSICGPCGDIQPRDPNSTSIDPPTPEPSPLPSLLPKPRSNRRTSKPSKRHQSDATLSTISEEPSQASSSDVVVEPQVKVETTVVPSTSSQSTSSRDNRHRRVSHLVTFRLPYLAMLFHLDHNDYSHQHSMHYTYRWI